MHTLERSGKITMEKLSSATNATLLITMDTHKDIIVAMRLGTQRKLSKISTINSGEKRWTEDPDSFSEDSLYKSPDGERLYLTKTMKTSCNVKKTRTS